MKKQFLLLLSACFLSITSFAQSSESTENAYSKGKSYVSVGYGFPNFIGFTFRALSASPDVGTFNVNALGPIYAKYEYGLVEKIGLSFNVAYAKAKINYTYSDWDYDYFGNYYEYQSTETINYQTVSFNVKPTFHFLESTKGDLYAGAGLGVRYRSISVNSNSTGSYYGGSSTRIGIGFDGTFGGRYYFTKNIGAYGEIGFAKSLLQFGITAKF
jgi:hypothetical protein